MSSTEIITQFEKKKRKKREMALYVSKKVSKDVGIVNGLQFRAFAG